MDLAPYSPVMCWRLRAVKVLILKHSLTTQVNLVVCFVVHLLAVQGMDSGIRAETKDRVTRVVPDSSSSLWEECPTQR